MEDIKPKPVVSLYVLFLMLLAAALPLSRFAMSVSQFLILGFWLCYRMDNQKLKSAYRHRTHMGSKIWNYLKTALGEMAKAFSIKCKDFYHNKPALILASIWLLHIVGLFYTSDLTYAFKDIRVKLPLLLLPLCFASAPKLSTRQVYAILMVYIAAVCAAGIYRLVTYYSLPVPEKRDIYVHTSHIRFSLNAVVAIFSALYLCFEKNGIKKYLKLLLPIFAMFLLFVMILLNYYTGIVIVGVLSICVSLFFALKQRKLFLKLAICTISLLLAVLPILYVSSVIREFHSVELVHFDKLDKATAKGNPYTHDTVLFSIENGKYVGLYICDTELREEWRKCSSFPFDGLDQHKGQVRNTLIRYLASKDLRKDAWGIKQLTKEDILKIEKGIAAFKKGGFHGIKAEILHYYLAWDQYEKTKDANNNSMFQRFEYWKASLGIIRENLLIGVGTGDAQDTFNTYYKETNSLLYKEYRLRSHNQYLAITVAFGLLGFLWFLIAIFYPMFPTQGYRNYFYIVFFLVFLISMSSEDTLETQEGATFFAFFASFLLLAWVNRSKIGTKNVK